MKKNTRFLLSFLCVAILGFNTGCSKNDEQPIPTRKVEYRMIGENVSPVSVTYTGADGDNVFVNAAVPLSWSSGPVNIPETTPLVITGMADDLLGVSSLKVQIFIDGVEKASAPGTEAGNVFTATAGY